MQKFRFYRILLCKGMEQNVWPNGGLESKFIDKLNVNENTLFQGR